MSQEKTPKKVKTKEEMNNNQSSSEQEEINISNNTECSISDDINAKDTNEEKKCDDDENIIDKAEKSKEEDGELSKTDESNENSEDNKNDSKELMDKIKKTTKLAQALSTAYKIFMTLQLLAWLKHMLSMIAQAIIAAVKGFWAWLVGIATKIVKSVAVGFGISPFASAVISAFSVGVGVTGVGFAVYSVVGTHSSQYIAERDAYIEVDCAEDTFDKLSGLSQGDELSNSERSKIVNEYASKVYSLFKQYGLAEENIAGIIGNFSAESGIDPTRIEGVYGDDEYNSITGKKKSKIVSDWENYTLNTLFPLYERSGRSINKKAFIGNDKKYYPGIGLGQWTGPRATLLFDYAKSVKMEWFNIDTQLAFMITDTKKGGDTRSGYFVDWQPVGDPEIGADEFAKKWEGHDPEQKRREAAASWFTKMQNGKLVLDKDYGESILAAAKTTAKAASDAATAEKSKTCNDLYKLTLDNSSIVSAAISLSYPYSKFESQSVREKSDWGTELYQEVNNAVHDETQGAPEKYRDCGRFVRTVLKWCGADKDYHIGDTASQYTYLSSSKKWKEIDWQGNYEKLSPGDILITRGKGHVCIYVGYEAIVNVYPDTPDKEDIVICSASMDGDNGNGYPPCCRDFYDLLKPYAAFRCVNPDNDTTFKNVGTNVSIEQAINKTDDTVPSTSEEKSSKTKKERKKGK